MDKGCDKILSIKLPDGVIGNTPAFEAGDF